MKTLSTEQFTILLTTLSVIGGAIAWIARGPKRHTELTSDDVKNFREIIELHKTINKELKAEIVELQQVADSLRKENAALKLVAENLRHENRVLKQLVTTLQGKLDKMRA